MATTTLLLNGFSVIGVPLNVNSNASHGGELMIHDGTEVWDDDDIIMLTVTGANPDGTLSADAVITGITVYEHATDYFNDVPKFTYTGSADLDVGRNHMGDRYLDFDASGLTSSDPGAPVLEELVAVAGVDILDTLANQNGPLEISTNEDIDFDGDGVISGLEAADGLFSSDLNILTVICFARGTLIDCPDGPRYIETLREGDLVNTLDHGAQPIRWIGARKIGARGKHAPVRIRAGALGNVRDLVVSPNHRMLLRGPTAALMFGADEILVSAKYLVNDRTIRREPRDEIEYYNFLFDGHEIVFSEGAPSESLYPGPQALESVPDESRAEIIELFPELAEMPYEGALARRALKGYEAKALVG
ncbi:Hint domain-containing protein [Mesobacterium pallidum]|uniref:Hint domain-containing protein n=1 Tax=Mesobacterium pallidum TaxID=2872037 RepID=UPI001EE1F1A1|nr:Hint domain-containing protein [Mesobacterium pallidum]